MSKKSNSKPMKLKPVIYSSAPKYPTNEQFDRDDIFKMIPKGWKQNRAASILLSTLLVSSMLSTSPKSTCASLEPSEKTKSLIAPVFKGGDGFVSFGDGDAVEYYSFSETDGFDFIKSILAKQHIKIEQSDKELTEVQLPLRGSCNDVENDSFRILKASQKKSFRFDGVIHGKSKDVFVEFVTTEDKDIAGEDPEDDNGNIDTQIGANLLQTELKVYGDKHAINAAVLYDPVGDKKNKADEQLKEQIRQFISWMKAEGII